MRAGPGAPRVRDILLPDEPWRLVAEGRKDLGGATCNARGEVFFLDRPEDKVHRIDPNGKIREFLADAGHADALSAGPKGELIAASSRTGKVMSYDPSGRGSLVVEGLRGRHIFSTPAGGLYVTCRGDDPGEAGEVWFVEGGRKSRVDSGLKLATGLAYRPDRWLLAVADGRPSGCTATRSTRTAHPPGRAESRTRGLGAPCNDKTSPTSSPGSTGSMSGSASSANS